MPIFFKLVRLILVKTLLGDIVSQRKLFMSCLRDSQDTYSQYLS